MARFMLIEREIFSLVTVVHRDQLPQARAAALRLACYGIKIVVFSDADLAARFLATRPPLR